MQTKNRPVVFAYYLWGNLATSSGFKDFAKNTPIFTLKNERAIHCPLVNFTKGDIVSRSKKIGKKLNQLVKSRKLKEFDLVGFSMAGVDLRLLVQEDEELASKVQNLVSVASPLNGTVLSDVYLNDQLDANHLEKTNIITGTHYSDLMECTRDNMKLFKEYVPKIDSINYHTVIGDKSFVEQCDTLQRVSSVLLESKANVGNVFNDGLFFDNEVREGENYMRFNADHYELSPLYPTKTKSAYHKIYDYLQQY